MAYSHGARLQATLIRSFAPLVLAAALVSGCSIAIPLPGLIGGDDEDITGSIAPADTRPFAPELDREDWRRARAALATALDPQGNGERVAWDNPQSGRHGDVRPAGLAAREEDRLCRLFEAQAAGREGSYRIEGRACRSKAGEWAIDWSSHQKQG